MKYLKIEVIVGMWKVAVEALKSVIEKTDKKERVPFVERLALLEKEKPNFSESVKFVSPKELKRNAKNPRIDYDITHLDITCGYIREPLIVRSDGTIVRGHLRHTCALENKFSVVPIIIREFSNELDELSVLNDHGTSKPLSKFEVYKSACAYFELGIPRTGVWSCRY